MSGTAAGPPARRRGGDRQEHDRRRVRRADRRRRLRAALPDGRDDGHRPRAAGLHVPARARRRDRGDRDHARPRGPPRRAAVGAARARPGQRAGRLRRPADGRDGALQARRAQAARGQARGAADRRHRPGRPVHARAHPPHALDPRRRRRGADLPAGHHPLHGRLQVRPDAGRRARPPTWRGWPSSAARACCCCAATPPTPTARASRRASRSSARTSSASSTTARAGSSSPASPRTSTASSRSSTPRPPTGARSRCSGRSMRKNVNIGRTLGHIDVPEGMLVQPREADPVPRREAGGHLHRLPGRAAERRCAGWRSATIRRSSSSAATRSSSPRRRSPATSARSTRRSTGCTRSAATS